MKQHRYQVTLHHLADPDGNPADRPPLQFEVGNHDDIFAIVERMRQRTDFTPEAATALGVGLKLFSEVMLENRDHPLFASFRPHFAEFMKELKKG
ncbi:MAG TPA: DUF3861 domain-containing protein [Noviherbaspirillum sp.]|jgi:hypothetical protein|uniref:DUF3861 domain-containing protein n=1 Tax=Noviherbaspirillum sp. TaxID=1926288 RepID=UPI002F95EC7C